MRYGYDIVEELIEGLALYLEDKCLSSPADLIGRGLPSLVAHEALSREWKVVSRVDRDLCVGCGACVIACRDGGHQALSFPEARRGTDLERVPATDDDKCIGCGFCPSVCPVPGCITMKRREEMVAAAG